MDDSIQLHTQAGASPEPQAALTRPFDGAGKAGRRRAAAARESLEEYHTLFDTMGAGLAVCELIRDECGAAVDVRCLELNAASERQTGQPRERLLGQTAREIWGRMSDEAWLRTYQYVVDAGQAVRFERLSFNLNRWYDVTALPYGGDRFAVVFDDISARKQLEAERQRVAVAEARAGERQALLKRIVEVQEAERRQMAHEVHDGVTQLAHAAALRLDGLVDDLALVLSPQQLRELQRARDLTRQAVSEARHLIAGLRPEGLDQLGLAAAVRQEVEALQRHGWRATFEEGGTPCRRLSPEQEITLYRVAQEALANVRSHAGRCRVRVWLEERDGAARLEIRDWGRGFDLEAVRPDPATGQHVGLAGMRERMALLGGRLELRSGPERGATVRALLPLQEAPGNG